MNYLSKGMNDKLL